MVTRAAFDLRHLLGLVAFSSSWFAFGAISKPTMRCNSQGRSWATPPSHPLTLEGSCLLNKCHQGVQKNPMPS